MGQSRWAGPSPGPGPRVACCTVTDTGRVVVGGAGLAGLRTVGQMRARGLAGRVPLIGAGGVGGGGRAGLRGGEHRGGRGRAGGITLTGGEPRPPYAPPPLSKKVLTES